MSLFFSDSRQVIEDFVHYKIYNELGNIKCEAIYVSLEEDDTLL